MKLDLNSFVVRVNGNVDINASAERFAEFLAAHLEQVEKESQNVRDVVVSLYEENKGKVLVAPVMTALAAQRLGATAESYEEVCDRITEFVKANSSKTRDGSLFREAKGRRSAQLWSHIKEE